MAKSESQDQVTIQSAVLRERHGPIEIVTINRPAASNAFNVDVLQGITVALDEFETDETLQVLILTATGERAFSAGMDFVAFLAGAPESDFVNDKGIAGLTRRECPKPIIAAVNGAALGGGFELALGCDLIVASDNTVFGIPELKVGHLADGGALLWLPQRLPYHVAMELALTGDPMNARRAKELGLVNEVVSSKRLLPAAMELAQRICANAPESLRQSKRILSQFVRVTEDAWRVNAAGRAAVMASPDSVEGARAFLEKREPRWVGFGN